MRPLLIRSLPRPLHSSRVWQQYHFDTQALVSKLEAQGFSHKQSIGVMSALEDVVQESIRSMESHLVTRAEQEKHQYTQKVAFVDPRYWPPITRRPGRLCQGNLRQRVRTDLTRMHSSNRK
jgi:hypothetical protein